VERRALRAEQWRQRHARMDEADRGGVGRRLRVKVVGGKKPSRARHALHDEIRFAGDVIAHVRGEEPPIFGIAAGDAGAEQDADGLAFEEWRVVLRSREPRWRERKNTCNEQSQARSHLVLNGSGAGRSYAPRAAEETPN